MTSEMGEMFNDLKKIRQQKRSDNRNQSAQILTDNGINFLIRNGGAHLIVQHNGREFDFWPGTGKWIERGSTIYKRGVFNLIAAANGWVQDARAAIKAAEVK